MLVHILGWISGSSVAGLTNLDGMRFQPLVRRKATVTDHLVHLGFSDKHHGTSTFAAHELLFTFRAIVG